MSEQCPPGAPTKYKPEYCQMLLEHFDIEPYTERINKIMTKSGDLIEVPKDEASDFPSFAGFARRIGVNQNTLRKWTKAYPEFDEAYQLAKDMQEDFLLINGNKGLIHPQFGMFSAKNLLGYRDKQPDEADVIVNNNNQFQKMSDEELAAKERELLKKHGLLKGEDE